MDGGASLSIHTLGALSDMASGEWDNLANPPGAPYDPFVSWNFLQALEESGCVDVRTGWRPAHLSARERGAAVGAMPLYFKDHSYGEYVFDHAWADALQRAGGRYYPKLQCAVPFTPAPGSRIFARDVEVERALAFAATGLAERAGASSVHATFASGQLCARLEPLGYLTRIGLQYHWFNRGYAKFDGFLADLSSQKRKAIRRERTRVAQAFRGP